MVLLTVYAHVSKGMEMMDNANDRDERVIIFESDESDQEGVIFESDEERLEREKIERELLIDNLGASADSLPGKLYAMERAYGRKDGHFSKKVASEAVSYGSSISTAALNNLAFFAKYPEEWPFAREACDTANAQLDQISTLLSAGNATKSWRHQREKSNISAILESLLELQRAQTIIETALDRAKARAKADRILEEKRDLERWVATFIRDYEYLHAGIDYYKINSHYIRNTCERFLRSNDVSSDDKVRIKAILDVCAQIEAIESASRIESAGELGIAYY